MPIREEDKTIQYIHSDGQTKKVMGETNRETWQFMKERYVVLRNFIPKDIINMCLDAWKTVEANEDWDNTIMYRETNDITHNTPLAKQNKSKGGYCTPWGVALHRWLKDALEDKIDLDLGETYSYTRKYERGAYLTAHTDRPSCEVSATLCLDYKTDDGTPWKIWLQNDQDYIDFHNNGELINITQGLPQRNRKNAKCISLEVGDILLYQGPNIPHWRDTFVGDYSYHLFVHFYNRQSRLTRLPYAASNDKEKLGMVGEVPPNCVLEFDGRGNRYNPADDNKKSRKDFYKFVQYWDREIFDDMNANRITENSRSDFCNNYDFLTKLEDVKKEKRTK